MESKKLIILFICTFSLLQHSFSQDPKFEKQENVVYGVVSGAALLMDVYTPSISNQRAIVFIPGSAFGVGYSTAYDEDQLKEDFNMDTNYMGKWATELINCGFTVFVINHRFAPGFRYSDIISDCQRAVRFIRFHAKKYGINPDYMGAMGHSSGGNLASLLGVMDDIIIEKESPVEKVSSRVQAVVTLATPFNLVDINPEEDSIINRDFFLHILNGYMGELPEKQNGKYELKGKFAEAYPISHISADDAPTLIYYSDNDPIIPIRHAISMHQKLVEATVSTQIRLSAKSDHNPVPDMKEVCNWFGTYLGKE